MNIETFKLDEIRAREWLDREAEVTGQSPTESTPFNPLDSGSQNQAIELVVEAQRRSILTGPARVHLIYVDDEDGGTYDGTCYVLVDVDWRDGESMRLASPALRWRSLAWHDSTGAAAAIGVLRRVTDEANAVLHQLRLFVRSHEDNLAVQRAVEEASLVEFSVGKPPRAIPADVAVTRDQLAPGVVVRRWTEFVRGSRYGPGCTVTTRVPCCDRRVRLQYDLEDPSTTPILCTHCRIIYDHELIPDSDEGYWAVLAVRRITFIPTMRTKKKGRTL